MEPTEATRLSESRRKTPELLAPAGNLESFFAALESGADAVYLGLKELSARALAPNFTLDDLARILPYAHARDAAVHVALNSLVTALEFPRILDLLQSLADLAPDAVIVQDPGIFQLARDRFPTLTLHASTLMGAHNAAGVNALARLGASRIVLARELSFDEIRDITRTTTAEIEIFVHGALCFSFSGLCLASSFRGGHSGLQGRCVQPCRLKFRQGKREGYFLSCNDFSALDWIPRLKALRIAAFKIEGRMKSADYIAQVVRAYRDVMDAPPDRHSEAIAHARERLGLAPARKLTQGHLEGENASGILTPHRSGSSGLWVGNVLTVEEKRVLVDLRHGIRKGDRLRTESPDGREQKPFAVQALLSLETSAPQEEAGPGEKIFLKGARDLQPGERLFRIGGQLEDPVRWRRILLDAVPKPRPYRKTFPAPDSVSDSWPTVPARHSHFAETLLVKVGRYEELGNAMASPAHGVLLTASKPNLERLAKARLHPAQKKRFAWSLPPVILPKDLDYYQRAVRWFVDRGYRNWELNNWGHFDFFRETERPVLTAGHRFNVRNPAALAALGAQGCTRTVLSLEITGREIQRLLRSPLGSVPVVTVYAWPALFTSRLKPALLAGKPFVTPRNEPYLLLSESGITVVYADRPVSWLARLAPLRSWGVRCFLIDLSEGPRRNPKDLERVLSGFKRGRADEPFSEFNWDREPVKHRASLKDRR